MRRLITLCLALVLALPAPVRAQGCQPGAACSGSQARSLPAQRWLPLEQRLAITVPPEQGRAWWLALPARGLADVRGQLGDWPIHFFRQQGRWVGLGAVPALAPAGTYTLTVTLTGPAGRERAETLALDVLPGGYASETITLDEGTSELLDPSLVIPERERILSLVAPVTAPRYWADVFWRPALGQVTSEFGTRRSYNGGPFDSYHAGVDFSWRSGLDIRAPAPGLVVLAERLTVRGGATLINHGWGVYSGFWHQQAQAVQAGDWVEAGQIIGTIGGTGLATGAHLHWELFVGGVPVDPLPWTQAVRP
jgi:murein DD-endopeptidase MepM/ murein hydrolase activator NlpD